MINAQTFRLDGRIALVTGSSSGIGLALARGLAQAGATVVLNGRNADKLAQTAALLEGEGLQVHARAFDVTQRDEVDAGIASIEASIGPICASIAATPASTSARFVTSKARASTCRPSPASSAAACASLPASRPFNTIRAPACPRPRASARPMPLDEPVTSASWPSRRKVCALIMGVARWR